MIALEDKCTGCLRCIDYCPMSAIEKVRDSRLVAIDQGECVDCGVCYRAGICPTDALFQPPSPWPRSVRGTFSNPLAEHPETRIPGRGTEEMKTNDVTGRYAAGYAGMAVELGRPGTGARFHDVQRVAQALAALGIEFEPKNPVTFLMVDKAAGTINPEVLDEKVLSAIVEFTVPLEKVEAVLSTLRRVAGEVNTVFSVDIITRARPDGTAPTVELLGDIGQPFSINGKTNMGLGRPRAAV